MPLTTEGDRLVPERRVHKEGRTPTTSYPSEGCIKREEPPQPIKEEAIPQRMMAGETVGVNKIEMEPPNIPNPKPKGIKKSKLPIPSPTMQGLEDVDGRFLYYGTSVMEIFFPKPPNLTKTQALSIQTFPGLNQNLPHLVKLAKNDNPWPQANTDIKQPERGKIRNNGSTQWNTNMGSHKKPKNLTEPILTHSQD